MKAFKKLLMLFVALFMIAGCDTPEQNDSSSGDISGNITTESPSSVEDSSDTSSAEDSSSSDELDDEINKALSLATQHLSKGESSQPRRRRRYIDREREKGHQQLVKDYFSEVPPSVYSESPDQL